MKTKYLLIALCIISLLGCGLGEEIETTECYTSMTAWFENTEEVYAQKISFIRNPDGTWSTIEQCRKQHQVTLDFVEEYKEAELELNKTYYAENCTERELGSLKQTANRLILEMEGAADINYNCD